MSAIRYHKQVNVLQGRDSDAGSPFARAEWFALLAGPGGIDPLVVEDDRVALPLFAVGRHAKALANWYSFTWQPVGTTQKLSNLAAAMRNRFCRVELSPLPDEDGRASTVATAFRNGGWIVRFEQCDVNHVLPVSDRDFAAYLAQRPGKLRTTIKRKRGKVECRIMTEFQADAWALYERIYAASWKPEEGRPEMLRAFAEQEGTAGRLRLGLAYREGVPVAAQFWTVESGTAFIHKLGQTPEANAVSAGTVLTAALFEHVIDTDKVDLVDFGTGNDPYKADWMEQVRPRYRMTAYNPRRPTNWPAIARVWAQNLASRVRNG